MLARRSRYLFFHIIKVKDHNDDIGNAETVKVDLPIQVHALFCVTFHISGFRYRCLFPHIRGRGSQR